MNPLLVLLIIALLGGAVAPPLVDYAMGDNIYPDNPLYQVEKLGEQIRLKLAELGLGNYTNLLEHNIDERLQELNYCLTNNTCPADMIHKLIGDYNNTVTILVQHLIKHNKTQQLNQLKLRLQQHKSRIQHLLNIAITTGVGETEISIENTIKYLNDTIHEIEIHIQR